MLRRRDALALCVACINATSLYLYFNIHQLITTAQRPSHIKPTREAISCEQRVRSVLRSHTNDPGEVNRIRRSLSLHDPSCYHRTASDFVSSFRSRLNATRAHLHLHISKAGGTSLCELARRHMNTIIGTNCWDRTYFFPAWCKDAFKFADRHSLLPNGTASCDRYAVGGRFPEFVMNENYLDHPLCMHQRLYSVSIREAVNRAESHVKHLWKFQDEGQFSTRQAFLERMELVQRNYMTWALAADAAASTNSSSDSRFSIIPQREQLDVAKDTLSRFDFLLDISGNNETCTNATLNLMGFGNDTIGHGRKKVAEQYVDKLKEREQYEDWNLLDSKLYEYARQLMDTDCDFFLQLLAEEECTTNTTTWPVSVITMERNESIMTPSPSAKQNDA